MATFFLVLFLLYLKLLKLTAKVKLVTSPEEFSALLKTMKTANSCCDWVSGRAWKEKQFGHFALHKLVYYEARERYSLASQMTIRCIGKVSDAYSLRKSQRRYFREYGAFPYDRNILSWKIESRYVSIWTIAGRLKIPFQSGDGQLDLLKFQQGESDLILQDGIFYLAATCNVDNPDPVAVKEFLGVDLGVTEIASTSDGQSFSGATVKGIRHRHRRLRAKLQKKQMRSAKRRLRKLSGKEARFAAHTNHCISKELVETARRTNRGIAIEDLKGIRDRIRARRDQRAVLHSWSFAQLRAFLTYKAALAGVRLVTVDPRNSSRECSQCGHTDKLNRPSQSRFSCRQCGFTVNADINAACVIAGRGASKPPIRAA